MKSKFAVSRSTLRKVVLLLSLMLIFGNSWIITLASNQQQDAPYDFSLEIAHSGVELYKDNLTETQFVQVVDLSKGASVKLLHGNIADTGTGDGLYGGDNPSFERQSLQEAWNGFSGLNKNAFCITNGQFFSTNDDPTWLAFSLKRGGVYVSDGYAVAGDDEEYPGQKLMLEIWGNRADITPLTRDNFYNSNAPNIIAGLTEDANKGPSDLVGRTFVGVDDANGDGIYEDILIYNSPHSTQSAASNVLRDFGADKVMMLDGGGSTQLICDGNLFVPSSNSRTIPQTLAVLSAPIERYLVFISGVNSTSTGEPPLNGDFEYISSQLSLNGINNFIYFSYAAAANYIIGDLYCTGWENGCSPTGDLGDLSSLYLSPIYDSEDTHLQISLQADALDWLIGQIVKKDPYAQIDIIGFSLGGILASYWGSHNGIASPYKSNVHGIIALESPLGGIPIAAQCTNPLNIHPTCILLRHQYGVELLTELQIPEYLPGSIVGELPEVARNFSFTSIQSNADYTVNDLLFPLDGGIYGNLDVLVGRGSQYWVGTRHTLHMDIDLGGYGLATYYVPLLAAIDWIATNHRAALGHQQTAKWIIESIISPVERGLYYLHQRHLNYPNGSWANNVGITGLAVLAFLNPATMRAILMFRALFSTFSVQ